MSSSSTSIIPAVATRRVVCRQSGKKPGPLLICIGSLHGNEPAGVEALMRVSETLEQTSAPLRRGAFLGLAGNLAALQVRQRFVDADLNRHWSRERIERLDRGTDGDERPVLPGCTEDAEMKQLLDELAAAEGEARGPVYLLDLHTTSGDSPPFATVGNRAANRRFARRFGVPVIVGLQDGLVGTLLSHTESRGYFCMGFEGGRHNDPAAVDSLESVIWLALSQLDLLAAEYGDRPAASHQQLRNVTPRLPRQFEVRYRYAVDRRSAFRMQPGFASFKTVARGELLATDHGAELRASQPGRLLMPLYQEQGEDGFFLMREYSGWLHILHRLLSCLPAAPLLVRLRGVESDPEQPGALLVDAAWNRGLRQTILLALGYRSRQQAGGKTRLNHRHGA